MPLCCFHSLRRYPHLAPLKRQQNLVNSSFDEGPHSGWLQASTNFSTLIIAAPDLPNLVTPRSPDSVAWLGGRSNERGSISQDVAIPAGYPTLQLRYYYWSASVDADCRTSSDVAYLKINDAVERTFTLCKANDTNGWRAELIPVAHYANQTVSIRFEITLDGSQNSNIFIDDLSFVP